ncbi:unnamed protein product, partial [Musa acuminata subsp. burmannicoides]
TRGGWGEGGDRPTRLESKAGVAERTMVRGSNGSCSWPTLGNNHNFATTSGPRNHIVVRHQALRIGCDNEKG